VIPARLVEGSQGPGTFAMCGVVLTKNIVLDHFLLSRNVNDLGLDCP